MNLQIFDFFSYKKFGEIGSKKFSQINAQTMPSAHVKNDEMRRFHHKFFANFHL
jgi:hypothetical protein